MHCWPRWNLLIRCVGGGIAQLMLPEHGLATVKGCNECFAHRSHQRSSEMWESCSEHPTRWAFSTSRFTLSSCPPPGHAQLNRVLLLSASNS